MRSYLAIITIFLFASSIMVNADQSKFRSTLTSLVNMQSRAVDAVDAALDVLRGMKETNVQSQAKADETNRTQEQELGRQISQLTDIADQNKASGDAATAHRKYTETEIRVTQEYLTWNTNRRADIQKKRESFREHRCISNLQFVKSLKEHDEALQVIQWLKSDVLGIVEGGEVSLAEINNLDSAKKLSAYTHLFNQQALQEFSQLTQGRQDVDASTAEYDSRADDNTRDALQVERMGAGSDERDVGNKLLQAIDRLLQHLQDSIEHLEKSEIQAAWDLAKWLQATNDEIELLEEEYNAKTAYIDRLLVAIVGAKAREDQAWEIYFESATTLNDALHSREEKRQWYAQEKSRRQEENQILDEIIRIFIERVQAIDGGIRNKVNDFSVDGVFDDSRVSRSVDTSFNRDSGRLQANLDSETRF